MKSLSEAARHVGAINVLGALVLAGIWAAESLFGLRLLS